MRSRHGRRLAGVVIAFALVAAVAAPIAARRAASPRVHVSETVSAAAQTPPTLVPGAPTTFVTLGTDKVLRVTDTPGNAALVFIHEAQGHVRAQPGVSDDTPLPPTLSELTPGTITITSKDQIAISTTSTSKGPACKYTFGAKTGMEQDALVTHYVVCQMEVLSTTGPWTPLQRTNLVTSATVDLGDQDDSLKIRADPIPPQVVRVFDTESSFLGIEPIEPHYQFLNDLQNWNVYGGTGNDWLDVNVWSREGQLDNATGFGLLDPDAYNMPWHLTVAHIHGGEGNDTLTAGYGSDYVYGENGNDSIIDLAQKVSGTKDHLYGGLGNDAIEGRDGPDDIDGGAGTDTIVGGTGKDHIYANDGEADQVACGGQGDVLYYDAGKDTVFSC